MDRREITIDGDLGEIGAEHIGERPSEHIETSAIADLPLVGTQVFEQPRHQAAVVGFA